MAPEPPVLQCVPGRWERKDGLGRSRGGGWVTAVRKERMWNSEFASGGGVRRPNY